MAPKFSHDCPKCRFVGNVNGKDAYVCQETPSYECVNLRHGNEPEAYGTFPRFLVESTPQLKEYRAALALAG